MKNNKNKKSIDRLVPIEINNRIKMIPVSEEEYVKGYFNFHKLEIVTESKKFVNALKNGDYVIGLDYNPMVLQNVFHYRNGLLELFAFKNIGEHTPLPLKLQRVTSIYAPHMELNNINALISNYDELVVSRKGILLDTEDITPSLFDKVF